METNVEKGYLLVSKPVIGLDQIIYEIRPFGSSDYAYYIQNGASVLCCTVVKVTKRGWTLSTYALTCNKCTIFLPRENFDVKPLNSAL